MYKNHEVVVFAVEHYNTLGIIRSLGEKGLEPDLIAIKGKTNVSSSSKYVRKCYYVNSIEEGYRVLLDKYGNLTKKPFVLFIDDKTLSYVDERYDELKDKFYFFNAGAKDRIYYYMNKYNILEEAKKHGLKTLKTVKCKKGEVPDGLIYPIITKSISPVVGGWKADVHICNSQEELLESYKDIKADEVLLQEYIEKKNEYALQGYSVNQGKDMTITEAISFNYLIPGYYSPYMTCYNMDKEDIKEKLKKLIADIGFEGIFEIEFLIDKDDNYYFSEINFRASAWNYSSTVAGMNMPYLWIKGMLDGEIDPKDCKRIEKDFTAMAEPIDYGKRVDTGMVTKEEWLADLLACECPYYYNSEDREPFYVMLRNFDKLK